MSFIKKIAAVTTIFAATAMTASVAHATPFTNGDFEQQLSGWTYSGNLALTGPGYFGAGSAAKDGNYMVTFNAGDQPANAVLMQTFDTVAGATYAVKFGYGMAGGGSQELDAFVLDLNGTTLAGFNAQENHSGDLGTFTFSFKANSSSTTLKFVDNVNNNSHWLDGVLDNVSVTNVPEPGSLAILALGMLGLGLSRKSNKKVS